MKAIFSETAAATGHRRKQASVLSRLNLESYRRAGVRIERVYPSGEKLKPSDGNESGEKAMPEGTVTLGEAFQAIRELPGASATVRVGTVRSMTWQLRH